VRQLPWNGYNDLPREFENNKNVNFVIVEQMNFFINKTIATKNSQKGVDWKTIYQQYIVIIK
jgi:hypothetical protein